MDGMEELLERLVCRDTSEAGDYVREDGILMCGKCHTPKQCYAKLPVRPVKIDADGKMKMRVRLAPVSCQCRRAALEREREYDRQTQFNTWMAEQSHLYGISGGVPKTAVFEADDGREPQALEVCRRYVDTWPQMRQNNIGILFCGANGTGKSFHAEMIVNALLKKRIPSLVTSFPALLAAMEKFGEKREIVNHLRLFELAVIDDLGAERDSSYALEQVFNVIDARYRQKKPLIVTTNILYETLKNETDPKYKRIYERVVEMCPIVVSMNTGRRRAEIAREKKRLAESILKGVM